ILGTNATGNKVEGNFIGTDLTGTAALANARNGVLIYSASGNIVGGVSPAARNVISGNGQSGIYLFGSDSRGNLIQGNLIGTDVTGAKALGNGFDGIGIENAPGNIIGGTIPGAGNLISGNPQFGISINNSSSANNQVQGNFIGTDVSGKFAIANTNGGIG